MNRLLVALMLFGCVDLDFHSFASPPPTQTVDLSPSWRVGNRWEVEYTLTKEDYQGEKRNKSGTSRTPLQIEVVEVLPDGFVLNWTQGKTALIGDVPPEAKNPLTVRLLEMMNGLTLRLRTDENASVLALLNSDEVRAKFQGAFDELIEWARAQGASPADIEQLRASLGPIFGLGKELSDTVFFKEPSLLFAVCGMQLRVGEVAEFENLVAHPLLSAPLPAVTTVRLIGVDPQLARATVEWKNAIDTNVLNRKLIELLNRSAVTSAEASAQQAANFVTLDTGVYLVDARLGWPLEVTVDRQSTSGDVRRTEHHSFKTLTTKQQGSSPGTAPSTPDASSPPISKERPRL